LVNELEAQSGRIREGVNVKPGYYDQAQQNLDEAKTLFQEISDTYPRLSNTEIRTTLAAFMFKGDDVFKPISALSGGERGRVALAKIMLAGANFLILDEPTNHLDLFSKELLEDALRDFPGTLLYISHDRYFINNTATCILELSTEGITRFPGNYDDYLAEKQKRLLAEEATEAPVEAATSNKADYHTRKEQEANERKRKARITRLETEIAETEAAIATCDEKLTDDTTARDAEAAAAVFNEKTTLEEKLAILYDEWETSSLEGDI